MDRQADSALQKIQVLTVALLLKEKSECPSKNGQEDQFDLKTLNKRALSCRTNQRLFAAYNPAYPKKCNLDHN